MENTKGRNNKITSNSKVIEFEELTYSLDSISDEIKSDLNNLSNEKKLYLYQSIEEGNKERLNNYIGQWLPYNPSVTSYLIYKLLKNYQN